MLHTETQQTRAIDRAAPKPIIEKENRRIQRIALPLPVRVEVRIDSKTNWSEITRLSDVSAFGAGLNLKRPLKRGRLLLLSLPMPRQLRSYDYSEPQYKIWGLVRRCISIGKETKKPEYSIGIAFTGKNPPVDYIEHPSRLYEIAYHENEGRGLWRINEADLRADDSSLPNEARKQTRYFIPESLTIEQVDDAGNVILSETTVTENISLGGASVFTTMNLPVGSFVRVLSPRHNIEILSVVRGYRVGDDRITRLHIEFIDRYYPLEGIESQG